MISRHLATGAARGHAGACLMLAASLLVACAGRTPPPELAQAKAAHERMASGSARSVLPARAREATRALVLAERAHRELTPEYARQFAILALRKVETAEILSRALVAAERRNRVDRALAVQSRRRERLAPHTERPASPAGPDPANEPATAMAEAPAALGSPQPIIESSEPSAEPSGRDIAGQTMAERATDQPADSASLPPAAAPADSDQVASTEGNGDLVPSAPSLGDVPVPASTPPFEPPAGPSRSFSATRLFGAGESSLQPDAAAMLDTVAAEVSALPGRDPVIVEVHSGSAEPRSVSLWLSQQRAEAVRAYLVARGADPERVTAVGVGPDRGAGRQGSDQAGGDRVLIIFPPSAPHER